MQCLLVQSTNCTLQIAVMLHIFSTEFSNPVSSEENRKTETLSNIYTQKKSLASLFYAYMHISF